MNAPVAGRSLSLRTSLLLFVVLCGFYWLGNWSISLFDRDEPRFAQPAKEMLFAQSGRDWIVPHFNGVPLLHKPPLCYWQMVLAYRLFGINEFAARFFSGFWTAATAVVLAGFLARRFSPAVGLVAGLAFATSLMVMVEARLATAEGTLVLLTVLAVVSLWDIYVDQISRITKPVLWLAVGFGILCKGPAIFVVLIGLAGTLLVLDRDRRWVRRMGLGWGIPLALAIGLPWYFAADALSGGGVRTRFLGYDLIRRFQAPVEGHGGFPGFYAVTALVDTWPWSAFLIPVALFAWKNRGEKNTKLLLAWLLGPTVLLEVVRTKMVHYWLIILPAYAILLAMAVDAWVREPNGRTWIRWRRKVAAVISGAWLLVAVGILAVFWYLFGRPVPVMFLFAGILLAVSAFLAWSLRKADVVAAFFAVLLTTALVAASLVVFVLPALEPFKLGRQLARLMTSVAKPGATYVLVEWSAPSTIFYLHPGNQNVTLGSADAFLSLISKPGTVIGLSEKGYKKVDGLLTRQNKDMPFLGIDGYEYTLGRKTTAYVAASPGKSSR
jgi:4-amino-4-deoxy-L-arabinose transferase-like glycosyltransferase